MGDNREKKDIQRSYGKLCFCIFMILLLVITAVEFVMFKTGQDQVDIYKVEIGRVENELRAHAGEKEYEPDLSVYETIRRVVKLQKLYENPVAADPAFFNSNNSYGIRDIAGTLYRIEYDTNRGDEGARTFIVVNIIIAVVIVAVALVLLYIYFAIIRNFHRLSEYPLELSKGNLTAPLKARKTKYFGRFLWGLDMLRDKLESEKNENLELQKEKNVFLLSLSHDIKTPLSAIKLYSAALRKNLYTDPEKIRDVAEKIDENAGEIENYVAKVISTSGEDFLHFDVRDGEFYLSEAMGVIESYYSDKLENIGTALTIDKYTDILIAGDRDRFVEVLQNIFENAIKYGDGRHIGVSFEDEDGARLISVTNSGCTLSEEELGHIFDSFYRGSNVGSRGGSGLGLYICKKLMGRMKGDVFAEIVGDRECTPTETTGDWAEMTESMRQRTGNPSKNAARCMKVTVVCSKR